MLTATQQLENQRIIAAAKQKAEAEQRAIAEQEAIRLIQLSFIALQNSLAAAFLRILVLRYLVLTQFSDTTNLLSPEERQEITATNQALAIAPLTNAPSDSQQGNIAITPFNTSQPDESNNTEKLSNNTSTLFATPVPKPTAIARIATAEEMNEDLPVANAEEANIPMAEATVSPMKRQ